MDAKSLAPGIGVDKRASCLLVVFSIFLFLAVSPAIVEGQAQTGSVSGVVYGFTCGSDVIPITGATVAAVNIRTGDTPQPVATDAYGAFKMSLAPGEYKIFITAAFFQTQGSYSFNVTSGSTLSDLTFYLSPATPVSCQPIPYQNFLFRVPIYSNGTSSSIFYDLTVRSLSFRIYAVNETARRFLIAVPRGLLDGTPVIFVDGSEVKPPVIEGTHHFFITLDEPLGMHDVMIQGLNTIPEFSESYPILVTCLLLVSFVAAYVKRKYRSPLVQS